MRKKIGQRWIGKLAILLLCTACVGGVQALGAGQTLRIGLAAQDIGPMDPHQPNLAQDTPIQDVVWELLVGFKIPGDVTSEIVPVLAESWEVSEDQLTWTFHLRRGVKFHHGYGEMTAEDVEFSFDRVRDPARSGKANQPPWTWVKDTVAKGPYTVAVQLKRPVPDLLAYLAYMQSGGQILCKKAVQAAGDKIRTDNIVGTGPWMWGEYVPQDHITLVRNPDYWQGKPILDSITYLYMPSDESRTMAFLSGEIDIVKLPLDQALVEQLQAANKIVDILAPGFGGELIFNMSKSPLDNWLVRAAIAYAIDRQEIADAYGAAIAAPEPSVVPEGWLYGTYENVPTYDYNPELAKALLAAAGYPEGLKLQSFTSTRDYYRIQFEVIQAQLDRVGIDLELTVVDHTTFHANQRADLNDLVIFGNGGWNGEEHLWQFWHSDSIITKPTGALNFSHYGEIGGSIDDLLELALGKPPKAKAAIYAAAQRKILIDLAGYPTIWVRIPLGRQPYVDLGYEPVGTTTGSIYNLTWRTRVLAH